MNKKGQTLVLFVIFLPILLIVIQMIINKNNMYYEKRNMENIAQEALNYGLTSNNEEIISKINNFIDKNIECEKEIEINNNILKITLKKENSTIKKILGYGNIEVKFEKYIGEEGGQ